MTETKHTPGLRLAPPNRHETELIQRIAARASSLLGARFYTRIDAMLDVSACHLNGCPLDLERLLSADDFNFIHDVSGIHRHLNRVTGELADCFRPRFAARAAIAKAEGRHD